MYRTFLSSLCALLGDDHLTLLPIPDFLFVINRNISQLFYLTLEYLLCILEILGSELWEDDISSILHLVNDYMVDLWELQKARLYDENIHIPIWGTGGCWGQ